MKATLPKELEDDDLLDDSDGSDSDELPSGLNDSDEDGEDADRGVSADEVEEEPVSGHKAGGEEDEEDDDVLSLVEGSDAEDLLSLDADVPDGLIEYDGSDAGDGSDEAEEWGGFDAEEPTSKKRKRSEAEDRKSRRKKLRSLPTFASYEDYAKLIEDGPEDNI